MSSESGDLQEECVQSSVLETSTESSTPVTASRELAAPPVPHRGMLTMDALVKCRKRRLSERTFDARLRNLRRWGPPTENAMTVSARELSPTPLPCAAMNLLRSCHTHLEELDLDGLSNLVEDSLLRGIALCNRLRTVAIRLSSKSDFCDSFENIGKSCLQLTNIRLDFSEVVPKVQLSAIKQLSSFPSLTTIGLRCNLQSGLDDEQLWEILRCRDGNSCALLRSLSIYEASNVSEGFFQVHSEILRGTILKALETFLISDCPNLTDTSLIQLVRCLPRAHSVEILNCSSLTPAASQIILKGCQTLRLLHIASASVRYRMDRT